MRKEIKCIVLYGHDLPPEFVAAFAKRENRGTSDQCWEWQGVRDHNGYGILTKQTNGIRYKALAHRIAWEMANGRKIGDGLVIRHACDNPSCVNPAHLSEGTHLDNVRDRVQRDRSAKGSKNGRARFDEVGVKMVHLLLGHGWTPFTLAMKLGVDPQAIRKIKTGENWAHLHSEWSHEKEPQEPKGVCNPDFSNPSPPAIRA